MRTHTLAFVFIVACSTHNNFIGPDDAALVDGSLPDGVAPSPDGGADAATPDGGNVKNDTGYSAGSRLKVVYYEGSDGSEQAIGFFDSQRNENCGYELAADSVIRCLPLFSGVTSMNFTSGAGFFSDAACTQQLGLVASGCVPNYAWTYATATACTGTPIRVFTVGAKNTATTYIKSGNTCSATTITGDDAYAIGNEVAAASFQDATMVTK